MVECLYETENGSLSLERGGSLCLAWGGGDTWSNRCVVTMGRTRWRREVVGRVGFGGFVNFSTRRG